MVVETVKYKDFNGVERTEDYYFNFSPAEIVELEASYNGGLEAKIRSIIDSQDTQEIMKTFKELFLLSYGEKSEDGRHFHKSPELSKAFSETPAYSILVMRMLTNEDAAVKFFEGICPPPEEIKQITG